MSDETNPYKSPQQDSKPPAELLATPAKSEYLGGYRLALNLGVVLGMFNGWIWMFLPTTSYDLLAGAMATLPLFGLGLLILFVSDRRVAWLNANVIRNGFLGAALLLTAVALFFPVCTGTVMVLDPLPDALFLYRVIGFVAFTATFAACMLFVSRAGVKLVLKPPAQESN